MNKLNRKCKQCGREWSCIPRKYGKEPCDSDCRELCFACFSKDMNGDQLEALSKCRCYKYETNEYKVIVAL